MILPNELDAMRREAVCRRRRVIYNDDGGEVKHMETPDWDDLLSKRLKHVVGTHVDSVFYCGHDNFTAAFYESKVQGTELCGSAGPGLRQALAEGRDPSAETIDFCKNNDLEAFWSFRMNDIHNSFGRDLSRFKRDHPEWLLGSGEAQYPEDSVARAVWAAMDFAVPEVRNHAMACIEEVCRTYDLDGIEFDYGRNASLFRPTLTEEPVSGEQMDTLTEFQRELRKRETAISRERGRPLLLAAVVPETVELCRFVGIDVEAWLKENLIDIVIAGNGFVPFSMAVRDLMDLVHDHGMPVYPRLDVHGGTMYDRVRVYDKYIDAWRGAALNYWQAGADGIYLFNAYRDPKKGGSRTVGDVPLTQVLAELGDVETLRCKRTLYCVDMDLGKRGGYNCGDIRYYMPRKHLVPVILTEKGSTVHFTVEEDLAGSAPLDDRAPEIRLRLRVAEPADHPAPVFLFNDQALPAVPAGEWREYDIQPSQVRAGVNTVTGRLPSESVPSSAPTLTHVELWVDRGGQET